MFKLERDSIIYQNDPPWNNVRLGNSSETIGGWGGLLTSITMMLNAIGYPEEYPYTVNEKLKRAGGFLKALPVLPYVAYVWPNCNYFGITRCENSDAPIAKIDEAVAAGKPVILQVDSKAQAGIQIHFVLVKEKKGEDYVVYDPLRYKGDGPDKEVLLTQRYYHNGKTLESEISAVLWFDFDRPELPKLPEKKKLIPVPSDRYTIYAAEERLVLRAEPFVDSYPWKCLFKGTRLLCLESKTVVDAKMGVKNKWIQVQDPAGVQGYVSARLVTSDLSKLIPDEQPSRKKWCLKNVAVQHPVVEMRLFREAGSLNKIKEGQKPVKSFDTLRRNTVVSVLKSDKTMSGLSKIRYEETYRDSGVGDWVTVQVTGWVNEADLDDYHEDEREEFRKFIEVIDSKSQTESSTDGQQYIYINDKEGNRTGKARYNLCGELSVAFVAGKTIDDLLKDWQGRDETTYNRMVGNADQPLSFTHVQSLLDMYEIDYLSYRKEKEDNPKDYTHLAYGDEERRLDRRRASQKLQENLKENYFITNLKIDTNTGDLVPAYSDEERNHWVVLDRVTRGGTRVVLYNPFPNRMEEYSFGEFYRSIDGDPNSGWWVKKKKRSAAGDEEKFVPPAYEVAIDNRTQIEQDAEQYLYIRGEGSRPKTKLCGEFCVSFILDQSLPTSLGHWLDKQKELQKQGEQADLWELATLLQAYGFNRRKYIAPGENIARESGKYYVAPNINLSVPKDAQECFKSFSIDTVLEFWKGVQPDLYYSILGGNNNEPTGPDDLITILKAYGYGNEDYSFYRPGSQEFFGLAPGRDADVVGKTHFLLAGVNIHGTTGSLQPSGVPHWVVVTKITPRGNLVGGNGGWVELYNPFPNRWEEYSYREFMDAFRGSSAGTTLWIKKDVSPDFELQSLSPAKSRGKDPGRNVRAKGKRVSKAEQRKEKDHKRDQEKGRRKRESRFQEIGDNPPLDANRLACKRLEVEAIPWEIGVWIREAADENEFFAEQLTDILLECGILSIQEEVTDRKKTRIAVLTDPEFSEKLQAAIQNSIDGLSLSRRDPVFRVASAVLPFFTQTVIEEIKAIQKTAPVQAYKSLKEFRAWTLGLASKLSDPLEEEIQKRLKGPAFSKRDKSETFQVCNTILTRSTSRAFGDEIQKIHSDPVTMDRVRDIWKTDRRQEISFAEVREWAHGLNHEPRKRVYRVKKWGDPGMINIEALQARGEASNFQAVGLYNTATGFGAISNYLVIPPEDVLRLETLQLEDEYQDKRDDDWLRQKMNWLCKYRGCIYMFAEEDNYKGEWPWRRPEGIRWGTLALGGNLVQVVNVDTFEVKLPAELDVREVKMAQLKGFTSEDWDRPLNDLLAEGLVHRCFCVFTGNKIDDTPKGIVYSPFWSPEDWEFMPRSKDVPKPTALWIPLDYLENPPEE